MSYNPLAKADADGHCPHACVIEGGSAAVGLAVIGVAAVGVGAKTYYDTPSGQRSWDTFSSATSQSFSSTVQSVKNTVSSWFSSKSDSNPAPAAGQQGQQGQQAAPAAGQGGQAAAPAVAQPNPGGQVMVGPSGTAVVIPPGQAARPADNGNGTVIGPPATVGSSNAGTTPSSCLRSCIAFESVTIMPAA